jgi:ecdysteroid 25-hydroxylase CYP306A1
MSDLSHGYQSASLFLGDCLSSGLQYIGLQQSDLWPASGGLLILLLLLLFILKSLRGSRYRLPPGPPGLPIIGNLHQLDAAAPYESLARLASTWGKVFSLRMGGNLDCVVIADGQLLRELFAKEECSGRAPLYLTHGIMRGRGIICAEGAHWAEQRQWLGVALRKILKGIVS